MHFKIFKTIYAFANTKGGDLYVGIENKKQNIEGTDNCDKKIVERILEQVHPIIKTEKEDIQLKNGRVVIKIKVYPLKIYDKPLFVDGILYVRENDTTKTEKSFGNYLSLYKDKQLYMCYVIGIKNNLKKLAEQKNFEVQQLIKELKIHIKSFIEKNQITGYERALNEAENLLDQINVNLEDDL